MTDNDEELAAKLSSGHCPDCSYRGFLLGPRGGASINIECANVACRSRFNVANIGWQIVMAHRIPSEGLQ